MRSRAAVSNLLRLLELPPEVCERLERREIVLSTAKVTRDAELVQAAHQVVRLTLLVTKWAVPSAMSTLMPPACGDDG